MKAYLLKPIEFAGRNLPAGVVDITDAEFVALSSRCAIRPATFDEAQNHVAAPVIETADAPANRARKK